MTRTLTRRGTGIHASTAPGEPATETLARSFDIDGLRLTKTNGTLVVEGRVASYRMKKLAGSEAARLYGARHVVNRLRVVPQSHRQDDELVEAVQAALEACSHGRDLSIAISTQHGIVVMQGSVCCSACRSQAEAAVWAIGGIVDVANRLRVARSPASHGHARIPSFLRTTRR